MVRLTFGRHEPLRFERGEIALQRAASHVGLEPFERADIEAARLEQVLDGGRPLTARRLSR